MTGQHSLDRLSLLRSVFQLYDHKLPRIEQAQRHCMFTEARTDKHGLLSPVDPAISIGRKKPAVCTDHRTAKQPHNPAMHMPGQHQIGAPVKIRVNIQRIMRKQ